MILYVGDRVVVAAHWSEFRGMRGTVTALAPVMVLLDGYGKAIRIDAVSLAIVDEKPAVGL